MMNFVHHSILEVVSILLVRTCHGGVSKVVAPDHCDDNPWYMAHYLIITLFLQRTIAIAC